MSSPIRPPLTVEEADGTPSGRPINKIVVSNGTLSISGTNSFFLEKAFTSISLSIPKVCLTDKFMSGSIFKLAVNFFPICVF